MNVLLKNTITGGIITGIYCFLIGKSIDMPEGNWIESYLPIFMNIVYGIGTLVQVLAFLFISNIKAQGKMLDSLLDARPEVFLNPLVSSVTFSCHLILMTILWYVGWHTTLLMVLSYAIISATWHTSVRTLAKNKNSFI